RISRDKMEPYFKLHKEANYTIIRNWVGQSTSEVFYDLADEYGLLVWNDFWMSTQFYNMPPNDEELFMNNAQDVVRRFINHPSIVLWCARNEGYAPASMEKRLADLVAKEDGTRLYLSNSRETNLRGSGPWHYLEPSKYYDDIADGFTTEVGTISFASAETVKASISQEDVWPISDTWYYHDLHTGHEYFIAATTSNFGESYNVEDFLERAQVINYDSHRAIFEAWNSKLWDDATGVMLWMTHPSWFSMIWQTYTSDYETHGAYFGAKKACEPVHIQMNLDNGDILAINTTLKSYHQLSVKATNLDIHGRVLSQKDTLINLNSNSKLHCFNFASSFANPDFSYYFTKLEMRTSSGEVLSDNMYMNSTLWHQQYQTMQLLDDVNLEAIKQLRQKNEKVVGSIILRNTSETLGFSIKLNARVAASNERVLPAFFSDGYFSLFPDEEKQIMVEFDIKEGTEAGDYIITLDGFNVQQTVDLN
ncbi:MAG: glycoside hydrolase family 2 TIM barrel-domain containing protein, partial [Bacteroidota bacterium]